MREIFDCVYRNRNFHFINEKKNEKEFLGRRKIPLICFFLQLAFKTIGYIMENLSLLSILDI